MSKKDTSIEIISHRCLGFGQKENSVLAMQSALASKIDGVEIDIRLTKDHKWIVLHNPFFKSEERSVLRVHEKNYSQLHREVQLLDSMLAMFAAHGKGKLLFIDVKDIGEEKQIVKSLRRFDVLDNVVVIAWEPEVLRRINAIDPSIKIGFSYVPIHSSLSYIKGSINQPLSRHGVLLHFNQEQSFDREHTVGKTHQHYLATLPELPLFSIQVPSTFCSDKLVKLAHAKKMRVYPFGVNTVIGSTLLRRRGIDGILTNYPLRFL